MLRISKMADYSTVIMVYLAQTKELCSVTDITQATHLAKPTVSKLVKRLVHANLLISERGTKGGYRIARDPDNISLTEIINAIEERNGLTECSDNHGQCSLQATCGISQHWQIIDRAIDGVLSYIKLTSLINPSSNLKIESIITHVTGELCEQ